MNQIKILEDLKQNFQELTYENHAKQEGLSIRFKALARSLLGENTEYIESFDRVHFHPMVWFTGDTDNSVKFKKAWESGHKQALNLIDAVIEDAKLFASKTEPEKNIETKTKNNNSKVFVVHGHDDGAKNEVARFIEKLGFDAIILHEQVNSGATIIEKLETHTDVDFAVVLYTACDIGGARVKPNELKSRARQNVVFEHGLMIGKIGRKNVVALVKDDVEIPNDISGVVYETMDSSGAWKYQIAKELKASGYDVDMNKI